MNVFFVKWVNFLKVANFKKLNLKNSSLKLFVNLRLLQYNMNNFFDSFSNFYYLKITHCTV